MCCAVVLRPAATQQYTILETTVRSFAIEKDISRLVSVYFILQNKSETVAADSRLLRCSLESSPFSWDVTWTCDAALDGQSVCTKPHPANSTNRESWTCIQGGFLLFQRFCSTEWVTNKYLLGYPLLGSPISNARCGSPQWFFNAEQILWIGNDGVIRKNSKFLICTTFYDFNSKEILDRGGISINSNSRQHAFVRCFSNLALAHVLQRHISCPLLISSPRSPAICNPIPGHAK